MDLPEKARLLERLKQGSFHVPHFIYVPAEDFDRGNLQYLQSFLDEFCREFKVIARSAHPREHYFMGGTFDSLETYADIGGIKYARQRIINHARTAKRLSIKRQQTFNQAPEIDLNEMGVIVMPFIDGKNVMAKMLGNHWEFGYSGTRKNMVETDPYITNTPHDRRLLQISIDIQNYLGFRCEIEYLISEDGEIHVVQAKDISAIEILDVQEDQRSIKLDGVRRIRRRRNYRERPIFVMDNKTFYLDLIGRCEDLVLGGEPEKGIDHVLDLINDFENGLREFALRHQRFAVLGISVQVPEELFQVANHYLDDTPELQQTLSKALRANVYCIDQFIAESDTLIAKVKYRLNLCTHAAYGVDTVRNPLWNVFWRVDRHREVVERFAKLGFKTGDVVGIEISAEEKPSIHRI